MSTSSSSQLTNTISASSIVEALKNIEKNPFSLNNPIPIIRGKEAIDVSVLRIGNRTSQNVNDLSKQLNAATSRSGASSIRRPPPTGPPPSQQRKLPIDTYTNRNHEIYVKKPLLSSSRVSLIDASILSAPEGDSNNPTRPSSSSVTSTTMKRNEKQDIKNNDKFMKLKVFAISSMNKIYKKEEEILEDTIDNIVPAHYLVKHGLFDMIKGKQLDKILKLLFKMRIQLLKQSLQLWNKHAKILSKILFGDSALTLHRVARGFLARRRVNRMYQEILKREKQKNKLNAIALMNKTYKITLIQACYRRHLAYLRYKILCREKASAITIQRAYKHWKYQGAAKKKFHHFLLQHRSAKTIQRVWRGRKGLKKANHLRLLRYRLRRQDRYETPESIFELFFEQHGAALCIQHWYNSLHFVEEAKTRARIAKRNKQLAVSAVKIQRRFRIYISKKILFHKIVEKKLKIQYKLRPRQLQRLIKAQACIRRYLTQLKTKELFANIYKKREKLKRARLLGIAFRREAICFEHLKIGDLRNITRLERKATIIQKWYKSARMLRYFYGMINNRRQLIAARIIRWYRGWQYRQRLKRSLRVIQPLWRRAVQKYLKRKSAQIIISRKYKAHLKMKWYRNYKKQRFDSASRIQRFGRRIIARKKFKIQVATSRMESELHMSGAHLFAKTLLFYHIDELNRRVQKVKAPIPKYELQLLFMFYCPNAQIDVAKATKIIKESSNLTKNPGLVPKELELIFAKVKGAAKGDVLDYSQLLQYLFYVACIKYLKVDASTLVFASLIDHNTENEKDQKKLELSLQNRKLVEEVKFGRLKGKTALIIKLVFEHISKNPVYKKNENTLDAKSAYNTSVRAVDAALLSIQRMFKVIIFRMGMYRVRLIYKEKKLNELKLYSAIIIQKYSRRYLDRRKCVRLSQKMYLKYIDNDSGVHFWTNSHLGTSHWVKPGLLRELDCGDGIKLPLPEEQYTPCCCECLENTAACFCEQCSKLFCNTHFASLHSSGGRKLHDCIKLEMCSECTFQVPTKRCLSCDELYCDTCFKYVHRRGRARLHTFSWVTFHCYFCDDRAAHWRRIDSWSGFQEEYICTVDFFKHFDADPNGYIDPTGRYTVVPVDYTGPTVFAWRKNRDQAEFERLKREAYKRQQEELAERRRQAAIITIQRVHRGVIVRRKIKTFISERKDFLKLRKEEWPARERWQYKVASYFGIVKALQYDTNKEKILRKYPSFLHEAVTYCLERKWGIMSQLLIPADLGELAPVNLGFQARVMTYMELQQAKFSLWKAQSMLSSREKDHQRSRERYRAARSSATAKDQKKKELQVAANKALKNVEQSKIQLDEASDSFKFAQQKYEYFTGPKDLQKLVRKRRSFGVPMPFTVDLVHNSRYAIVRYDKVSTDATISDNLFTPKPGRWRGKLKQGNIVKIQDMHFTIVEDVEDLLDIKEQVDLEIAEVKRIEMERKAAAEHEQKEKLRFERLANRRRKGNVIEVDKFKLNNDSSNSLNPEEDDGSSVGSKSISDVIKQKQHLADKEESANSDFVTSLTTIVTKEDKKYAKRDRHEFENSTVVDRIKLDRPWLFADMTCQDIHLITIKPDLLRMLFMTSMSIHKSWIYQDVSSFNALMTHKRSLLWADVAKKFDDESSIGLFFTDQSKSTATKRDRILKTCRRRVDLEYQFRVKERLLYGAKYMYNVPKGMIVRAYDRYKFNQAFKKMSPYRRWELSEEKKDIQIILCSGLDDETLLGFITMDLDAPLDVARDYIHRKFRENLNEICGSSFLFFKKSKDGSEDLVPFNVEEEKWSKDYALEVKNKKTGVVTPPTFYISVQGGEFDLIDEGNLSDEEDAGEDELSEIVDEGF